jgi:hypothetical protein
MRISTWFVLVLLAALAAGLSAASATAAGLGQIAASGKFHLQRPPTHLRMYVQLTGKGKTLEEALAALGQRREAATAKLEKLGVDKKSIAFTPPGVDESAAAQQRQMEAMLAQRRAKKPAKPVKPPVTVTTILSAAWPLTGDTAEKLLLAAEAVREKVKSAQLNVGKEKLSPEEQELVEEAARNNGIDESQQNKPEEPHFLFVAWLSPSDRQAALASAFAKAKTQAEELAKAAGAGLGPMTGLSGETGGGAVNVNGYNVYSRYGINRGEYDFVQQIAQAAGAEEHEGEAMAPKPDGIAFDFVVHATFALGETR